MKILTIDELIGNLKIYEMNKQQEQSEKEPTKKKTLALKAAKGEISEEDEDMTYITKRFLKVRRKNRGFQRRGNSSRSATGNDLCHKCENLGHFIKNFLIHNVEHKEDGRVRPIKENRRTRSLTKSEEE